MNITITTNNQTKLGLKQASKRVTSQVKQARNLSQIFNRKSISCNTTHRQFLHLQAMLMQINSMKQKIASSNTPCFLIFPIYLIPVFIQAPLQSQTIRPRKKDATSDMRQ